MVFLCLFQLFQDYFLKYLEIPNMIYKLANTMSYEIQKRLRKKINSTFRRWSGYPGVHVDFGLRTPMMFFFNPHESKKLFVSKYDIEKIINN